MATGSAIKSRIAELKKTFDTLRKGKDALLAIIDEAEVPESVYNSNAIPKIKSILMIFSAAAVIAGASAAVVVSAVFND